MAVWFLKRLRMTAQPGGETLSRVQQAVGGTEAGLGDPSHLTILLNLVQGR